ncbi:uncharacterized protein BO95DRAFT_199275 [Aspergillus brunneoviolaceus CBS 621.78]|uniref:Uncharacterized protein n=1 Tax=Aspergillus brunneoviolaceus CBS 621.78 TaxID=1450534 RepID=A0ACD1G3P5_9EURO|nr:hypothetical protein BO95DRAFT_199275 [Aspergillus brunneoviolaceus CBS 621.78]RAH43807.1 hypothetical protein BO95DRAFT_199275 [Aspergillus brunneoviolaceus CBS 621.78]
MIDELTTAWDEICTMDGWGRIRGARKMMMTMMMSVMMTTMIMIMLGRIDGETGGFC